MLIMEISSPLRPLTEERGMHQARNISSYIEKLLFKIEKTTELPFIKKMWTHGVLQLAYQFFQGEKVKMHGKISAEGMTHVYCESRF